MVSGYGNVSAYTLRERTGNKQLEFVVKNINIKLKKNICNLFTTGFDPKSWYTDLIGLR